MVFFHTLSLALCNYKLFAIGSTLPSPSGKGSVCSWDYILLSLDIEGVVLLGENRPWEGKEKNLLGNYCLDLCNVRKSQRSRKRSSKSELRCIESCLLDDLRTIN